MEGGVCEADLVIDTSPLSGLPLGWRSHVEVLLRTGATLADHGDHLVVRTADNPGYHWGNALVVTQADRTDDAGTWVARFQAELPGAGHLSIALPAEPDPDTWSDLDMVVEREEVLDSDVPPGPRATPEGYAIRLLTGAQAWRDALDLDVEQEAPTDDPGGYRAFAAAQWRSREQLCQTDEGAFFGAYHEGRQVAHLGIVLCSDHARYQSVLTHAEHRGRGLASALLATAGGWAASHAATRWVIVVDPGSAAARLYRALGFRPCEESWQVSLRSPR